MVMDTEQMLRLWKRRHFFVSWFLLAGGLCFFLGLPNATAEPSTEATGAFSAYVHTLESKLEKQHQSVESFLPPLSAQNQKQLQQG
jgi:hypothetical protein